MLNLRHLQSLLFEDPIPRNAKGGFLGTSGDQAHDLLPQAIALVRNVTRESGQQMDDQTASHFLDSVGGRHLAELLMSGMIDDKIKPALKKSIGDFMKSYDPSLFEANDPNATHLSPLWAKALSPVGTALGKKRAREREEARAAYLASKGLEYKAGAGLVPKSAEPAPDKKKVARVPASVRQAAEHISTVGIHSTNVVRKDKAVGEIRKLTKSPLAAGVASKKLLPHTDDPKLHSQIKTFAELNPSADIRPVVRKRMKELNIRGF